MSDSVKKYFEDNPPVGHFGSNAKEIVLSDQGGEYYVPKKGAEPREIITADDSAKYIFLLDYEDGKAYRYDISVLCREENKWNPDTESCEQFLELAGHSVNNCEWMVTNEEFIQRGN